MPETLMEPEPSGFGAFVPWSPAAIPATCVPCTELTGADGSFASLLLGLAGGNERATITFALVYAAFPLGKPVGIGYPAGEKNVCRQSIPSSTIPILIPWPALSRFGPQTCGAPTT